MRAIRDFLQQWLGHRQSSEIIWVLALFGLVKIY